MQNQKIHTVAIVSLAALFVGTGSFAGYEWWRGQKLLETERSAVSSATRAIACQDRRDFQGANLALEQAFGVLDAAHMSHAKLSPQLRMIAESAVREDPAKLDKQAVHELSQLLQKTDGAFDDELHADAVAAAILVRDGELNNKAWGPEFDGAEKYARKALDLGDRLQAYNADYAQIARALRVVADRHFACAMMCDKDQELEGHFGKARELSRLAVQAHERMKSPESDPEYSAALYRLGMTEKLFQNYDDAEKYLLRALSVHADKQRMSELKIDLAGIYVKQSEWHKAAALMKEVMAQYDRNEIRLDNAFAAMDLCVRCSENVPDFNKEMTLKVLNKRMQKKAEEILDQ